MNTPQALVSVGIPTYNRPEGLRRTLECITAQTYSKLEIIVSDNGSPRTETELVAREFMARDARIRFFRQQPALSISANFQFVLKQARGEFFMWAADDDEWDPDFVRLCVAGFDAGNTVSVMSHMRTLYRVQGTQRAVDMPQLAAARSTAQRMAAFLRCLTPGLFYGLHRREQILFFATDPNWFDFYDCYFVLRLLSKGDIVILDPVLYTAGVDAPTYQVKAARRYRVLGLDYLNFFRSVSGLITRAGMSLQERLWLRARLALTVLRLLLWHEPRFLWQRVPRWH
ncbi:MAG: glycosyltransferase family 2 protein [Proteobacteria bacterium]|nr:glycosyltransferase family 2 protein [Pseudomonadota bacterium]